MPIKSSEYMIYESKQHDHNALRKNKQIKLLKNDATNKSNHTKYQTPNHTHLYVLPSSAKHTVGDAFMMLA